MRFLVDHMCGGVVSYLRMCGYDTVYAADIDLDSDDEIVAVSRADDRTVVTRDVALANRADEAILLESREVQRQLAELDAAGVGLTLADEPVRCGNCNGLLKRVGRSNPTPEYAPDPDVEPVLRCRDCGQCFWKGSHWDRVRETLAAIDCGGTDSGGTDGRHRGDG